MKILFIAPRFHTNQVHWMNSLIENGHQVEFHSQIKGKIENYKNLTPKLFQPCLFSESIMKVFGEGGVNRPRGFPNPFSYYKEMKKYNPEIVVVRDITRWFSFLGALIGRLMGKRIIIYSQTYLHKHYSLLRITLIRIILLLFGAKWITPIKGDESKYKKHPKKLFYVPFTVKIKKKPQKKSRTDLNILTVGKFEDRKNHLMLLKVFKKLLEQDLSLKLTLIGEVTKEIHKKNFEICKNFIKKNNLENEVKTKVNIPHTRMQDYYQDHDLFVLPATAEPASISVLESVGLGTPSICSDTNGTKFYLLENNFGLTFKDNNEDDLLDKIKLILTNEKLKFFEEEIAVKNEAVLGKENFYKAFMAL